MPGIESRPPTSVNKETEGPREFCAVVGEISFSGRDVSGDVEFSLLSLQHRGQDGSGIASVDAEGNFSLHKKSGLAGDIFNPKFLKENSLSASLAIGHNRYATSGNKEDENCLQPFVVSWGGRSIAIAHNGNIPPFYLERIKENLPVALHSRFNSDSEVLGWKIMLAKGNSWPEKVKSGLEDVPGAYSLVIATDENELIGVRDRYEIRPLIFAETEDGAAFASETIGLKHLDIVARSEVAAGEMIVASKNTIERHNIFSSPRSARCMMEPVYFAHPQSKDNGFENSQIRRRMGEALAREYPVMDEDVIICGIPDSGIHIAEGYARALGRYSESTFVTRDRYGKGRRTFIQGSQAARKEQLGSKFQVSEDVKGKKFLLIDDSIIRGNTTRVLVTQFRDNGAEEVHILSASPPFVDTCDLGVDIASPEELIAIEVGSEKRRKTPEEIAVEIGADSVNYLSLEGLASAIGRPQETLCTHCLGGEHPIFSSKDLTREKTLATIS